ncbi:hypothetical protein FDECE_11636 [Fusarium decemcellulare]|nr:hypothetical protein FDECE_11636 [Fusarium decemcellulare]
MTKLDRQACEEPPSPTLSAILRELDEFAPPPAPPDLLTTVSALFSGRRKARRRRKAAARAEAEAESESESEAEEDRIEDARPSQVSSSLQLERAPPRTDEEYDELARLRRQARRPEPKPLIKLTRAELYNLIDKEVEKEMTGLGIQQAEGETKLDHDKRMRSLEERVDRFMSVVYFKQRTGPLRYLEGLPSSLIAVHPHVRPIVPPEESGRDACLQCQAQKMRCSRTVDVAYGPGSRPNAGKRNCSRCERKGERCLVKIWRWKDADKVESYKFAEGPRGGAGDMVKELLDKISRINVAEAFPAWHQNDRPENARDKQYKQRGWWNVLKDRDTEW